MNEKAKQLADADGAQAHIIAAIESYKSEGFEIVKTYGEYHKPQFALVHPDGRIWIVSVQAGKVVMSR